jgi:DNA-directed RNA polymerase subunit RPC12/RpoP
VKGCSVREVTAVYEVSYDLVQIGLLVGGIVGLVAGYVILRKPEKREERIPLERLTNGASPATVCPNCGSPVDAVFCPSCNSKLPK